MKPRVESRFIYDFDGCRNSHPSKKYTPQVYVEYWYMSDGSCVTACYARDPDTGAVFGLNSEKEYYDQIGRYIAAYGNPTEHYESVQM